MSIFARMSHPTHGAAARRRRSWRSGAVTLSAIVLVVLIPVLEVNDTHLFSPDWPAHARFHEAWQLLTNAGLAAAALWLALARGRERLAAGLVLIVVGSLILACAFGGLYGGAITRPGGDDLQPLGLSLPVLIMSALAVALLAAVWPGKREPIHL
ncbi:DUF6640 family protein [Brevundimonas sp.]|uniref:DUF6640 family protein n=1 Tax=Brevundimonas sp. TaxID=1871086 RepID=UPI0025BD5949|nr:DUF6640 family protein [Brevundimonas sp.]